MKRILILISPSATRAVFGCTRLRRFLPSKQLVRKIADTLLVPLVFEKHSIEAKNQCKRVGQK